MKNRTLLFAVSSVVVAAAFSALIWQHAHMHRKTLAPRMVYDAHGYGGFVPAVQPPRTSPKPTVVSEVDTARSAYDEGNFAQSERIALAIIHSAKSSPALPMRRSVADARQVLAYSVARQHDMKQAQEQFALLRQTAATLPGGGVQFTGPGDETPPLEQEAAFQHAVCTAALGDKTAAETEYRAFVYRYPQSTLVHAALSRVRKMHGGDLPAVDEAAWKFSHNSSLIASHKEMVARALCGPDCVSELLRRQGKTVKAVDLANEMGTTRDGTSLAALADVLNKHGYDAQGAQLNQAGLAEQQLPVLALLKPGHYVIVDAVAPSVVTVWDPDAKGLNHGAPKVIPVSSWSTSWQGVILALNGVHGAVSTASAKVGSEPTNGI